jgi:hypothetical protein
MQPLKTKKRGEKNAEGRIFQMCSILHDGILSNSSSDILS